MTTSYVKSYLLMLALLALTFFLFLIGYGVVHWVINRNSKGAMRRALRSMGFGITGLLATLFYGHFGGLHLQEVYLDLGGQISQLDEQRKAIQDQTEKIRDATERIAALSRSGISDFLECKSTAEQILEDARKDQNSSVKVAVYWPMFGADTGTSFRQFIDRDASAIEFSESPFYSDLAARFTHNLNTQLVVLDYREPVPGTHHDTTQAPMHTFLHALANYEIAAGQTAFPDNEVDRVYEQVVKRLRADFLPNLGDGKNARFHLVDSMPALVIVAHYKDRDGQYIDAALLFLGNVEMLRAQRRQGGFYTENPEMVEILDGLFASIWRASRSAIPPGRS